MNENWNTYVNKKKNNKKLANWIDCLVDSASSFESSVISPNQTPKFESLSEKNSQDSSVLQLRNQLQVLTQTCESLKDKTQRLQQDLSEKDQKIQNLEQKNRNLIQILEKNEEEKSLIISLNKSLTKSLQGALDEYVILTNELKKKWTLPDCDSKKLLKYSKFLIKTVKSSQKLKEIFEERVPSYKFFLQNVTDHNLETPFLNILQFLCDILLFKSEQVHVCTQTKNSAFLPDFQKVSPIKTEQIGDFFTEPDGIFENSRDGEGLMRNVNLQSERLAKLHKQISDTMQTNKMILTNPLKGDHVRSRSEILTMSKIMPKDWCYNKDKK